MANLHGVDFWSTELKRMLEEQRPENLHLDYKDKESLIPPGKGGGGIDKQKRAVDISKDVSSFLNSNGGVLETISNRIGLKGRRHRGFG